MGGFHGRSAYEARYDRRDQPVQLTGLLFVALSVKGTALSESAALRSRAAQTRRRIPATPRPGVVEPFDGEQVAGPIAFA
jgi:hypothetical protein